MADTPRTPVAGHTVQTTAEVEIDTGLRSFLVSVYNYMASGLVLTGLVAYAAAQSGLYIALERTPLALWAVILAPLGLVLFLSFRIEKMSLGAAQAGFWGYAGLIGVSLAGIFLLYTGTSIARTFFIHAYPLHSGAIVCDLTCDLEADHGRRGQGWALAGFP